MNHSHLIAAARLAREASQGRRTIELAVTEEGIAVWGRTTTTNAARAISHHLTWAELSAAEDLASNAVCLVDRRLSAMEGAA